MPGSICILIGTAVLGMIAVIFGLFADLNLLFALGVADTFLSLILLPVLYMRAKKRSRLFSRQDALLVWNYTPVESAYIAAREAEKIRKTSFKLSLLAGICLGIIFAPFLVIIEDASTKSLLLYIGIAAVILPFTSLLIAPAWTSRQIKRDPSLTVVGRDYILLNNRYIGINDRASLTLVNAEIKSSGDSSTSLYLTYTFTMKYGSIMHYTVEVPIPGNRTMDAARLAETLKTVPKD